jgi:hypothetical protein
MWLAALAGGVLVGVGLEVLTWWLAAYGPQGDGWSLRGNGALVVPFGLGPAVLVGGWIAFALHARTESPPRRFQHFAAAVVFTMLSVLSYAGASRVLPPGA